MREIEDIKITDEMVQSFISNIEKMREKEQSTLTTEYVDWLTRYVANTENKMLADDDLLYSDDSDDRTKSMLLSYFYNALLNLGFETTVDDSNYFPSTIIYFSYNDIHYKLETIVGQGSVTIISICNDGCDYTDVAPYLDK